MAKRKNKKAKGQLSKSKKEGAICPHCSKKIQKGIMKCPHCSVPFTFLGKLERISIPIKIIIAISSIVMCIIAAYSAWIATQERKAIKKTKAEIEKLYSEVNYTFVFNRYQQMENRAAAWRRCKALKQPDCGLLSLGFIVEATNAVNSFNYRKVKMKDSEFKAIQQLMCSGLSLSHSDGKDRGLYEYMQDHRDASMVDVIVDFIKKCPRYIIERLPTHKLQR